MKKSEKDAVRRSLRFVVVSGAPREVISIMPFGGKVLTLTTAEALLLVKFIAASHDWRLSELFGSSLSGVCLAASSNTPTHTVVRRQTSARKPKPRNESSSIPEQ